jgi:hypothetical protein
MAGQILSVNRYLELKKGGIALRLGEGGGVATTILKNQITFGRVNRQEDIF